MRYKACLSEIEPESVTQYAASVRFVCHLYMGVSKNSGTPKSSIFIGFSIINHPFWDTPIFWNTHIYMLFWIFCSWKAVCSNLVTFSAMTSLDL